MPETPIRFEDVEVVRVNPLGMWCRISTRDVYIGSALALPGTTLSPRIGVRGTLVLPLWFVDEEGCAFRP
jgi:hypothetical protein